MKVLALSYRQSKIMFWALVGVIVCASLSYMFFVNETVRNVVMRQTVEEKITNLNATVANLEFEYISRAHGVNMTLATSLGFTEVKEPIFVSKKQSVSFNTVQH